VLASSAKQVFGLSRLDKLSEVCQHHAIRAAIFDPKNRRYSELFRQLTGKLTAGFWSDNGAMERCADLILIGRRNSTYGGFKCVDCTLDAIHA